MKFRVIIFCLAFMALFITGCKPKEPDMKARVLGMSQNLELGTVEYIVKKVVKFDDQQKYTVGERKILFNCTAYLKAGIKLDNFNENDININDKVITVYLPHAELLSFNMPAEEITTVFENYGVFRSKFNADEQNEILKKGEEDIRADIPNLGILKDAEDNAKDVFEAMLSQLGFEIINIRIK